MTHRVLDTETTCRTKIAGPLRINLPLEIVGTLFIRHITRSDHETETDPEKQRVDCEEGSIVQDDPAVADE